MHDFATWDGIHKSHFDDSLYDFRQLDIHSRGLLFSDLRIPNTIGLDAGFLIHSWEGVNCAILPFYAFVYI